jgi:hypothetical protein
MESYTIDAVLAHQKVALKHCNNMVRCLACIARSDYMMLLVIVVDKLVDSCEQVVTKVVNSFSTKGSGEAQTACGKAPKMQFGQYDGCSVWFTSFAPLCAARDGTEDQRVGRETETARGSSLIENTIPPKIDQ